MQRDLTFSDDDEDSDESHEGSNGKTVERENPVSRDSEDDFDVLNSKKTLGGGSIILDIDDTRGIVPFGEESASVFTAGAAGTTHKSIKFVPLITKTKHVLRIAEELFEITEIITTDGSTKRNSPTTDENKIVISELSTEKEDDDGVKMVANDENCSSQREKRDTEIAQAILQLELEKIDILLSDNANESKLCEKSQELVGKVGNDKEELFGVVGYHVVAGGKDIIIKRLINICGDIIAYFTLDKPGGCGDIIYFTSIGNGDDDIGYFALYGVRNITLTGGTVFRHMHPAFVGDPNHQLTLSGCDIVSGYGIWLLSPTPVAAPGGGAASIQYF